MCTQDQSITYEERLPPETKAYRANLYNYLGQPEQWARGAGKYEGQLPYTGQPDYSQLAGMNAILSMLGYGPWQGQSVPPNATDPGLGGGTHTAAATYKYDPWYYGYPFGTLPGTAGTTDDPGGEAEEPDVWAQDPYAPRRV
uniref:Uncharacterized protein n=1 Tax=viral metagenome TaxID=1070528 RepID=A0A6M3IR48_9ZZZZ